MSLLRGLNFQMYENIKCTELFIPVSSKCIRYSLYFWEKKIREHSLIIMKGEDWHKPVSIRSGLFSLLGWKKSTEHFCFRMSLIYIFCLVLVTVLLAHLHLPWLSPLPYDGCSLWTPEALCLRVFLSGKVLNQQAGQARSAESTPQKQLSTNDGWGVQR